MLHYINWTLNNPDLNLSAYGSIATPRLLPVPAHLVPLCCFVYTNQITTLNSQVVAVPCISVCINYICSECCCINKCSFVRQLCEPFDTCLVLCSESRDISEEEATRVSNNSDNTVEAELLASWDHRLMWLMHISASCNWTETCYYYVQDISLPVFVRTTFTCAASNITHCSKMLYCHTE